MGQETRQRANRGQVARLLARAARELEEGLAHALVDVKMADRLANTKPTPSSKRLPAGIRSRTNTAIKTLDRLAEEVKKVPVSKDERLDAEGQKALRKRRAA